MSAEKNEITLFSHHPDTGQLADEVAADIAGVQGFVRQNRAMVTRDVFYWQWIDGMYQRVGMTKIANVYRIAGIHVRLVHNWPEAATGQAG